jgi:hypothetical protein
VVVEIGGFPERSAAVNEIVKLALSIHPFIIPAQREATPRIRSELAV